MSCHTPNTSGAIARITGEVRNIEKGNDLSLAIACRDEDVRTLRALIIGSPETPYEYGFFEFEMKMGKDYPVKAPHVRCITTNQGRCGFNPNIYAEGKVCLSILDTWRGEPGEQWSPAQGVESVMVNIQSLLSVNPYENEPSFETAEKEQDLPKRYIAKVRHETLRIADIKRLEGLLGIKADQFEPPAAPPLCSDDESFASDDTTSSGIGESLDGVTTPETQASVHEHDTEAAVNTLAHSLWDPFADFLKGRFLWYYDT